MFSKPLVKNNNYSILCHLRFFLYFLLSQSQSFKKLIHFTVAAYWSFHGNLYKANPNPICTKSISIMKVAENYNNREYEPINE